ncbi:Cytoplasmic tRNA 2-thiolation protein 2 [Microbotryomycetes sp. JL221]|nr:Cytoplasmic tRNA 2-thiolation protein 2 [Microbotryomycetes sp. JL221]
MLALSGGPASRAMLDLLTEQFPSHQQLPNRDPRRKVINPFESVDVVFVDESGVPAFNASHTDDIRHIVEETPFRLHIIRLEDVFDDSSTPPSMIDLSDLDLSAVASTSKCSTPLDQLRSFLSRDVHTTTSLTSLHSALLHTLLRRKALELGCEILMTGETATRLATKCLSGMALGRGYSVGEEMTSDWDYVFSTRVESQEQEQHLLVSRPMSQLLSKEVSYYLHLKGRGHPCGDSDNLLVQSPATKVSPKEAGIEALVQGQQCGGAVPPSIDLKSFDFSFMLADFVVGLEADFPSTVSTILRTSQKLGMRSADAQERQTTVDSCPLCGLPSQRGAREWRQAITISQFDKMDVSETFAQDQTILDAGSPMPDALALASDSMKLAPLLCYSCLLAFENPKYAPKGTSKLDRDLKVPLPPYAVAAAHRARHQNGVDRVDTPANGKSEVIARQEKNLNDLRDEINEFLIKDENEA